MDIETAMAHAINYLAQHERKSLKEMVHILLIEALTARGILHPLPKEKE